MSRSVTSPVPVRTILAGMAAGALAVLLAHRVGGRRYADGYIDGLSPLARRVSSKSRARESDPPPGRGGGEDLAPRRRLRLPAAPGGLGGQPSPASMARSIAARRKCRSTCFP